MPVLRGKRFVERVANRVQLAFRATRLPCYAERASMVNNLQRKLDPLLLGNDLHQILFDFHRRGLLGQVEPLRNSLHMRIHHHSGRNAVEGAEYDVGGLARGAGNGEHLIHGPGHFASEIGENLTRRANQRFRFVVEEARGANVLRQLGLVGMSEVGHGWIFLKQARRYFVDALISALRREDGGHQQLPGVVMLQRHLGRGVHFVQQLHDSPHSRGTLGCGLGARNQLGRRSFFCHTVIIVSRQIVVLLLAAIIAFEGCLWGTFQFDDYSLFSGDLWRPLDIRPITYLTFWFNHALGGWNPAGYHAFNLALHLIAVVLLGVALSRLIPARAALIAAAIFALHPFQADPVNYIFARSILLATLFSLASLEAWTRGHRWLAVAFFAPALLAKEECVAFPIFLLLVARREKTGWRSDLPPILAMLALSVAAGVRVLLATAAVPGSGAGTQAGFSPWTYFLAEGTVILRYLRMLVLPWGFTVDPNITVPSIGIGVLAWAGVLALAVAAAMLLRRGGAAALWFLGGMVLLLPSSSILPANDLAADRRIYLPMIGFAAAAGLLLERIRAIYVVPLLVVLAGLSFERTTVWRTQESLWSDAAAKAPQKVRPKIQLARAEEPKRALELLEQARQIAPDDPRIPSEEGRIYLSAGRPDRALVEFGRALALQPRSPDALNNRGAALLALSQRDAAQSDFERALAIDPCDFNARVNLLRMGIANAAPAQCKYNAEQRAALQGK